MEDIWREMIGRQRAAILFVQRVQSYIFIYLVYNIYITVHSY